MPRWRNAAAAARPPMPAPMMVMERTGFLTADAALLFERDIGGLDHAAPVRNFLLDVGAKCLGVPVRSSISVAAALSRSRNAPDSTALFISRASRSTISFGVP